MTYRFEVPGCPVPWQRIRTRMGQNFTAPETRAYQTKVRTYALSAGVQQLEGDLVLSLWFYLPDKRRRDGDNLQKTVQDSLNKIAYADDSQIKEWRGSIEYDKENPRAVVQVEER